jgi:chromosome segregation ATPase
LAYERLEGLRVRLYEQVEDERADMKRTQKRLEDELAGERKARAQQEGQWRARQAEVERESGRLAATVEVQGERLAQLARELEAERHAGREAQAKLLAASERIGALNAAQGHLLERLLPRLADGLGKEAAGLAGQDRAAVYAWLKSQLGELLPETPR